MIFRGNELVKEIGFRSVSAIERPDHRFLEVVEFELGYCGVVNLNNIQAFIIANIGREMLTVGSPKNRGQYLSFNVC